MGKMGGGGWGKEGKGTLDSSGWSSTSPPARVSPRPHSSGREAAPTHPALAVSTVLLLSLLPFAPPFPRVPSHTSQYFLPAARVLCPVRQCAVLLHPFSSQN